MRWEQAKHFSEVNKCSCLFLEARWQWPSSSILSVPEEPFLWLDHLLHLSDHWLKAIKCFTVFFFFRFFRTTLEGSLLVLFLLYRKLSSQSMWSSNPILFTSQDVLSHCLHVPLRRLLGESLTSPHLDCVTERSYSWRCSALRSCVWGIIVFLALCCPTRSWRQWKLCGSTALRTPSMMLF